jgi:hypothetical protein
LIRSLNFPGPNPRCRPGQIPRSSQARSDPGFPEFYSQIGSAALHALSAAFARLVEDGPILAIDGVIRWRACDLIMRLHQEFGMRPWRHSKKFPARVAEARETRARHTDRGVVPGRDAGGQKNKLTYRWARKGSPPRPRFVGAGDVVGSERLCETILFAICSHPSWVDSSKRAVMADQIVITEKSSQAKDVRAAVGSRYGEILPAEGHLGCCQAVPRWYGHGATDRGAGGVMTVLLLWGNQMVLAALSGAAILPSPSKTCRGGR